MTKIGNKGFMLAEVIIVSVVIITVLTTLYIGLNNVSSAYETRNRYYDIDSLYVAKEISNIINDLNISDKISTPNIVYNWIRNLSLNEEYRIEDFEMFYYYETNNIIQTYITPYDKEKMLELKKYNSNQTFSDYLDYLSTHLDFKEDYKYIVIVERQKNGNINDCYYYALKINK